MNGWGELVALLIYLYWLRAGGLAAGIVLCWFSLVLVLFYNNYSLD